jgi:hypothetical protein
MKPRSESLLPLLLLLLPLHLLTECAALHLLKDGKQAGECNSNHLQCATDVSATPDMTG